VELGLGQEGENFFHQKAIDKRKQEVMKITNKKDELLISIPKGLIDVQDIQDFLDFIRYKMIISKSEAKEAEIESVVEEINRQLREHNKSFVDARL